VAWCSLCTEYAFKENGTDRWSVYYDNQNRGVFTERAGRRDKRAKEVVPALSARKYEPHAQCLATVVGAERMMVCGIALSEWLIKLKSTSTGGSRLLPKT